MKTFKEAAEVVLPLLRCQHRAYRRGLVREFGTGRECGICPVCLARQSLKRSLEMVSGYDPELALAEATPFFAFRFLDDRELELLKPNLNAYLQHKQLKLKFPAYPERKEEQP